MGRCYLRHGLRIFFFWKNRCRGHQHGAGGHTFGWYIWAFFTYCLGTKIFSEPQTEADRKAVFRAMGFAASAGWIRALGVVPGIAWIAILVSTFWMLVASVIAVKQTLDYTGNLRAVGVCGVCWCISMLVQMTLLVILVSAFGISAPQV